MSRKWSPAADVARDKLFDQLMFSGLPSGERWQLIDDFAHALAEQIRAYADRTEILGPVERHESEGAREAADLIDPRPRPESSKEKGA